MVSRAVISLLGVTALAFGAGCSGDATEPLVAPAVLFSQHGLDGPNEGAGPPAASGFVVTRYETILGLFAFNTDVPFVVIMDTRNGQPFCGEQVTKVRPMESQDISNPSGALNLLNRATLFTRVYAPVSAEEFFNDACGIVTGPAFASGTAAFRSGWTNIGPVLGEEGGPGATVFHLAVNGRLEDEAGKTLTLHMRRRIHLLPDGTFKVFLTEGPELTPDPFR